MMCSGPFRGAQGHSTWQTRTEREGGHMYWKRGEVASRANCFRQLFLLYILLYYGSTLLRTNIAGGGSCTSSKLLPTTDLLHCSITKVRCSAPNIARGVKFLLGAGGWGGLGLGALGSTGLVLPGTTQNPARLVYGAALVASHRRATSPRFQITLRQKKSETSQRCVKIMLFKNVLRLDFA